MNPRLLLIKIATLLHLEGNIEGDSNKSTDLVAQLLEGIKIPEAEPGLIDSEREIIGGLYNICRKLMNSTPETNPSRSDLLQEIRLFCNTEVDIYEAFRDGVMEDLSQDDLKKRINLMRKDLKEHLYTSAMSKKIQEAAYKLKFKPHEIENRDDFMRELAADIETSLTASSKKDAAILGSVDMSDKASVVAVAKRVQDEDTGLGKLQTHLQDLNDMANGGFRRGEFVCTSALPHMNKTGFSLDIFEGIARNNEPYLFDVKKKPLLLRISFEDDVEMNFNHLFRHMWERETGEVATTADKDPNEIADYVMKRLTETGWNILMYKVDPSMWTIFDVFAFVREKEAEGYEVALCMLDYMRKMPTTGCMQGVAGFDIRDMARRARNFFNARKTTFYTPHQISTQAKEVARATPTGFVKMLPNGGYYDGCRSLDAEIDLEIFQHIEKLNGYSYLTLQRGKHRNAPQISEEKKYLVYKFSDIGGIHPDIGKERTGLRKVGGVPKGQEDQEYSFL